jgi:hypothetical protein
VGRPDAAGFGGGVARVGQRGVGERADGWGPCVSEGRGREDIEDGRRELKKKNVFCGIRQRRARAK